MSVTRRPMILCALGVIPVLMFPRTWVVMLWCLFVIAVIGVDYLLAPSPRRLTITRLDISPTRAMTSVEAIVTVTNTGRRRVRGWLRDAWVPSAGATPLVHRLDVPAGETVTLTSTLMPRRRGYLAADYVTVRSRGPLGFTCRQVTMVAPATLTALPEFPSRKHLPGALHKLQLAEGQALAKQRGQGTEFDSLREWVDGDDVRSIDWRATARTGEGLVVRTWRPERDRHIVFLMDTSRTSAVRLGEVARLDAQMDATLLLAAVCAQAGDSVSFLAGDQRVHAHVSKPGRHDVLRELSLAMTPLNAAFVEADWSVLGASLAKRGVKTSLLVILTAVSVVALEETMLPMLTLLSSRQRVVIVSIIPDAAQEASAADMSIGSGSTEQVGMQSDERPGGKTRGGHRHFSDSSEVYTAAAFAIDESRRARAIQGLESLGITVIEGTASEVPMRLVDHYLMLKARAQL